MHTSTSGILAAIAIAINTPQVFAQKSDIEQTITRSIDQVQKVSLSAGNLSDAINQLSAQTGVQILVPSSRIRGLSNEKINGNYSAMDALSILANQVGLQVSVTSDDALTLVPSENTQSEQDPLVETIFIVGSKQNLTLQETQSSVEVFDAERIDRDVLFSLDDILLRTANVSASNAQTSFSIRGIGQGGVGFAGTGRTSNVYVDGLPLTSNAQQGANSLWDVGQVEVLRGPQSTIQGRNALAGAIIMSTNDPTYDWEFRGRAQIATAETRKFSFVASGPLIEDQLAFRLAYDYQDYDGNLIEATTGIAQEFQESHTLRGKLLIEPESIPDLRIELTAEYVETDFGEFNTVFAPFAFDDPAFEDFDPFGGETFTRVRLENPQTEKFLLDTRYELSDNWTLIFLGTYEDNQRDLLFGIPVNGEVSLDASPTTNETYTAEFRATFDYENLSGWIGAYYFDSDQVQMQNFSFAVAGFGLPTDPPESQLTIAATRGINTENYALFADLTYELDDYWSFNLGARYDFEDFGDTGSQGSVFSTPESCTVAFPTGPLPCNLLIPANNTPGAPASFEAFLPRASVIYSFDEKQTLSFSVQRGYRAGGSTIRAIVEENTIEVVEFEPEYITNYEFAYRSQWREDTITFNANLFYTEWTDQQVSIPGESGSPGANDSFVANVGESELYGVELSLFAELTHGVDVYTTLGLLETKFTDFPFATEVGSEGNPFENLRGNEFTTAPNMTASFGLSYQRDDGLFAAATANYRSSQQSDVTNLELNEVGSYTLVNGRIGYEFDNFTISAFANNLFDRRFITRKEFIAVNSNTGAINTRANARFQINEERIVGISVDFIY
ncbi:MAG: TonB-dependent receptor [Pseudomonadota bacterium]